MKLSDTEEKLISYSQSVKDIISPLGDASPINYMAYLKTFRDGRFYAVFSDPLFLSHYIKNRLYESSYFRRPPEYYTQEIIMLCSLSQPLLPGPSQSILNAAIQDFNIDNTISFTKQNQQSVEFFQFGTKRGESHALNYYLNALPDLRLFIALFRDKASRLISDIETKKYFLSRKRPEDDTYIEPFPEKKRLSFESLQRFHLGEAYNDRYLTRQELMCLYWCIYGKSNEETALLLNTSKRTVESHLNHVKVKLNAHKQTDMVRIAAQLGIDKLGYD